MNPLNRAGRTPAEQLTNHVFDRLESSADPQIARQRLSNQLRLQSATTAQRRVPLRPAFALLSFMMALLLLGSWAAELELPGWSDGQQISIALPDSYTPGEYPHWVALMANHSEELAAVGGHSLVVDYKEGGNGYVLQLSLLGVNYSTANDWIRDVMADVPELAEQPYSITQPLVPYSVTVAEMLAYKLGDLSVIERSVARAWETSDNAPSNHGRLYLIAQPSDYARRVSMLEN